MRNATLLHRSLSATVATALIASAPAYAAPGKPRPRSAAAIRSAARVGSLPPGTQRPTSEVVLSAGQGELVTLPAPVADVWTSNPDAADVYVSNPRQLHLFGKNQGEATVFATARDGTVVYATNVRVSQNLTSIDRVMKTAMPDADIHVTTVGQVAVLTGTVASPDDAAQAQQIAAALLNPGVDTTAPGANLKIGIINRLRTATPLQVNLQVRFAEVSRSFVKNIGMNGRIANATTGNSTFAGVSGTPGTITYAPVTNTTTGVTTLRKTTTYTEGAQRSTLALAGRLFGADFLGTLDLGETLGQVTTLANPNLTALSGETGTFLAGGEIPILVSQGLGAISVEYKQYGVSLAYTPTVLSDGRISLRVRPEVSQLSSDGAVTLNGNQIPALTTRRAETTVELGSGQSFMIAGLLQNSTNNQIDKTPGLGDVPILGSLFRSNGWKRNETELVIVITPYLVKPVNANDIVLPTDGYKSPTDIERVLLGKLASGQSGMDRPKPTMAPSAPAQPAFGAVAPDVPAPGTPQPGAPAAVPATPSKKATAPAPGFTN